MAVLCPLVCIRPQPELAPQIATGPHSALSKEEIRKKVAENPITYTRIVHPRALFGDIPDLYKRAAALLREWMEKGYFREDNEPCYYLYRLECDGHAQSGLVGRTPVDEILNGHVHAHETIRESKLADLESHMEDCGAQIGGPILAAYRSCEELTAWCRNKEKEEPLYNFRSENGVDNRIWRIDDPEETAWLQHAMGQAGDLYIADGHHRVMAGVELCRKKRKQNPSYTGKEPWNYLACVCFPDRELRILPYSRIVYGLNGLSAGEFLRKLQQFFTVQPCEEPAYPERRGEFGLYLEGRWYRLSLYEELRPADPQDALDVSVLQSLVLSPILGIRDPRNDPRLEFAGGKENLSGLLARCTRRDAVGFLFYPVSMEELFAVADAEATMPPKSTWFEPKLCNGLFVYRLKEE